MADRTKTKAPVYRCRTVIFIMAVGCTGAAGDGVPSPSPKMDMTGESVAALQKIPEALPGAQPLGEELRRLLATRLAAQGDDYEPRTRHRQQDGSPTYSNRLLLSSSPYLQQHAHNPVNWYPWGDEAFETARKLNRPVLLSIGYSTCHWCHVMEEESFEDVEIATTMNEKYIAIKVDREVRPDVDAIYMQAVQMMTGRGGWPLNMWLTADRKPFFGGTYFPPRDGNRGARTGFLTILNRLSDVYHQDPEKVTETSGRLVEAVKKSLESAPAASQVPAAQVLQQATAAYSSRFDPVWGGLNQAPKFPSSLPVRFLLRQHLRTGDAGTLEMATLSLEKMADGGMYDQAGGGFHRYSTDVQWLVPHFEKMLYDNALLTVAYLEAWQVTKKDRLAQVAREILRYVQRDMTSPEGAFYSATDADSLNPQGHREEGWFFTWTPQEIRDLLGEKKGKLVEAYYGVTAAGNFEGRNILNVTRGLDEVAAELELEPDAAREILSQAREAMYVARQERPAPLRDEKILAAWNGLMISAYARAGLVLGEAEYTATAARAADFVLTRMRVDGRLLRSFKDGRAEHAAYLEDYAFMIAGLLDLYEAEANPRWIQEAMGLQEVLDVQYDDANGGYFTTADDQEGLLAREKPGYDGAEPSGNSVAVLNLQRLYEFTTQDRYRAAAEKALKSFGAALTRAPTSLSEMLLALDYYLDRPKEVILIQPADGQGDGAIMERLRQTFLPNRVVAVVAEGKSQKANAKLVPLLSGKTARDGKTTAYVCEQGVCKLPTTDADVFSEQISKTAKPGG